jgi:hypothetical protein
LLFYRAGGRLRRFTQGNFPAIKPADARREAQRILDKVVRGEDPLADKQAQRYARQPEEETSAAVVADYRERYDRKNTAASTFAETKRVLEGEDLKAWRKRPLAAISRRDLNDVIDTITVRAEVQANRTLAKLLTLFNWAVDEDRIASISLVRSRSDSTPSQFRLRSSRRRIPI